MEVDGISIAKATAIENASVISGSINGAGHLILVTKGGTQIDGGQVTPTLPITATKAQYNTALSDADFATLDGAETLTNKTLTSPVIQGIGSRTYARKAATTTRSNTAVVTDDPDLVVPLALAGVYEIEAQLFFQTNNTTNGGVKIQAAAPAGGLTLDWQSIVNSSQSGGRGGASGALLYGSSLISAANVDQQAYFRVLVRVGSATGNFTLQWAQNTANATGNIQVMAGSWLTAVRIA